MAFDHSIFSVYCNSRKVTHMLFGTGQLVKQCRLSTILISHKSKRQCLPFRQRSLLFPVMKLSAFPVSRMQFLLFFYFFSDILWFVFFTDFNVFCIFQANRQLVAMKPQLNWVSHRCILYNRHFCALYQSHIQKMLAQSALSPNRKNGGSTSYL